MNKIPVWFDTDIGVDDAVAFLVLHRQPELEVVGISAVSGNGFAGHHSPKSSKLFLSYPKLRSSASRYAS